jgi:cyclophilin family peptidyl-prolyl cis-trans isomerase
MHTNHGPIELELFDDDAPKTVENFRKRPTASTTA